MGNNASPALFRDYRTKVNGRNVVFVLASERTASRENIPFMIIDKRWELLVIKSAAPAGVIAATPGI